MNKATLEQRPDCVILRLNLDRADMMRHVFRDQDTYLVGDHLVLARAVSFLADHAEDSDPAALALGSALCIGHGPDGTAYEYFMDSCNDIARWQYILEIAVATEQYTQILRDQEAQAVAREEEVHAKGVLAGVRSPKRLRLKVSE